MEEVKRILEISRRFSTLLRKDNGKINFYLQKEAYDPKDIQDICRLFYTITKQSLENIHTMQQPYAPVEIANLFAISEFGAKRTDEQYQALADAYFINFQVYKSITTNLNVPINLGYLLKEYEAVLARKNNPSSFWQLMTDTIIAGVENLVHHGAKNKDLGDEIKNTLFERVNLFAPQSLNILLDKLEVIGISEDIVYAKLKSAIKTDFEKNKKAKEEVAVNIHTRLLNLINGLQFAEAIETIEKEKMQIIGHLVKRIAEDGYTFFQQPKRYIEDQRFENARRLISRNIPEEVNQGRDLLEQIYRRMERGPHGQLAKEWWLYAESKVNNLIFVYKIWEKDYNENKASAETKWNLAVTYSKLDQSYKALDVLKDFKNTSFTHLKFALYIGVGIYKEYLDNGKAKNVKEEELEKVMRFLSENLIKLPLADCYLVHLIITLGQISNIELNDYKYLASYLSLCKQEMNEMNEMNLVDPADKRIQYDTVIALQQNLLGLELSDTWILWLEEFVNYNYFKTKYWKLLSEAYIQVRDNVKAEEALRHCIWVNAKSYKSLLERQPNNTSDIQNSQKFLRFTLMDLFRFYNQSGIHIEDGQRSYKKYKKDFPELWDYKNNQNTALINASKKFAPPDDGNRIIELDRGGGVKIFENDAWGSLHKPISNVNTIAQLKALSKNIESAISLIKVDSEELKHKKEFIYSVVMEFFGFDSVLVDKDGLAGKFQTLNNNLQAVQSVVNNTTVFVNLKSLVSALRRVLEDLTKSYDINNKPILNEEIIGEGLDRNTSETRILIPVKNEGPGEISNIILTCKSNDNSIVTMDRFEIKKLPSKSEYIAAIPITIEMNSEERADECNIEFTFSWGVLNKISGSQHVRLKWFSFYEYLNKFNLQYDFISPYKDAAIDATDPKDLFQGREKELYLVKSRFLDSNDFHPIYFHGTRRVGKSSLLNRLGLELEGKDLTVIIIDLKGLQASTMPVIELVKSISFRILESAKEKNLYTGDLKPVELQNESQFIPLEMFFKDLKEYCGGKRIILLIDEFHFMVDKKTTDLLDMFRRLNDLGTVAFILAGLYRPEILADKAPDAQFSFIQHPLDFLDRKTIHRLITEPVEKYGINFHEDCTEEIFLQTAGNPFHISRIGQKCISFLNADKRTLIVPNDIERAAAEIAKDDSIFRVSSLSNLVISEEEKKVAINLAKQIPTFEEGISFEKAEAVCDVNTLIQLEKKSLIEIQENILRIRGKMLHAYLKNKSIPSNDLVPLVKTDILERRVGLFVDYENISYSATGEKFDVSNFVKKTIKHYSQYGNIVCRWVAAFSLKHDVKIALDSANFDHKEETNKKWAKKDAADFILLELITEETSHTQPDIFVIVAGDIDYIEKVKYLNKQGHIVRIVGYRTRNHINSNYDQYLQDRVDYLHAIGMQEKDQDFFIDSLEEILEK